jgi:hypothetical protein
MKGKSGAQRAYCKECTSAYVRFRAKLKGGFWRDPDYKTVFKRKYLKILDNGEPADPNSVPYIGYQIDRHISYSYAFNQRNGSMDFTGYYMVGHYALRRFWHSMNGTAWEQGPDNEEFLDGAATRMNYLKGKRWTARGMEPGKKR